MEIVELVVSDDELDVGDDEVAWSDVTEGPRVGNSREIPGDADPVSRP